ncbi:MAG: glycoside hydrolase family 2 protein [Clostridiales bacterium]|nr:glycoside hydrolase family 2 protein [Clostridiales bacterium]
MLEQKFNSDWKFWVDKSAFALVWTIPQEAEDVTLPHDAMLRQIPYAQSTNGENTGFRDGECYLYVKKLYVPAEYKNKTVKLKFEGVYMNAFVYVNGQLAGKNPFGYTTFYVALDDFLEYGKENEIRVQVKNSAMKNSRWYSGGGIYRDVYLLVSELAYMEPEGVQIKTESLDEEYAAIMIETEIKNRWHSSKELLLEQTVLDIDGAVAASGSFPVILLAGEKRKVWQRFTISEPKPWSDDSPSLYRCISRLHAAGDEADQIDESIETFGIRILTLDVKRGLQVNHHPVKLRGACIHHDSGLLGAATYEAAQFRQIKLLKDAGFNAVRMSHHPMAPAMLLACDSLGVYVMDEAFDMWNRCKSDYDYGLYFDEWWQRDVTAMVRKDYNHPSVILYSVGNEISEIGTVHGAKLCHELCSKIKELDSTRYTLASINGVFSAGDDLGEIMHDVLTEINGHETEGNVNEFLTLMHKHLDKIVVHDAIANRMERAVSSMDIAGYNYMTARYEMDGRKYPNRVIVGSETYPPEIARNWELVKKLPYVIGDFTWTGWDYIGEAGIGVPAYRWGEGGFGAKFPCQLAYCGDIDITGARRPMSYYREIVFGLRTAPYIAVQDPTKYDQTLIKTPWVLSDTVSSWTWDDCQEKPIVVEVYAQGATTELLINGHSQGIKATGVQAGYRVLFETIYERGEIKAISYDADGNIIGETKLQTANDEHHIQINQENTGEERELIYLTIDICDAEGITATSKVQTLTAQVAGGAVLAGFGSANPKPSDHYLSYQTETYQGKALLILKRTNVGEGIQVVISADELQTATFIVK